MLLLFLTVFSHFIGPSAEVDQETACYGSIFRLPFEWTPPAFGGMVYFTPTGGKRRVIIKNRKVTDPRIKIGSIQPVLEKLTVEDDGTFSVTTSGGASIYDAIRLKIDDCATETTEEYGSDVRWDIQNSEYIEFSRIQRKDRLQIVWNRTDPQKYTRGKVWGNNWEMQHVTRADSGFYNFRDKTHGLQWRRKLTVHAHVRDYEVIENEQLIIEYPVSFTLGRVTFTFRGTSHTEILMADPEDWLNRRFKGRVVAEADRLIIDAMKSDESGTFELRDEHGNLAMSVNLDVIRVVPMPVYIGAGVGIILAVIFCCCCMKKCCCKKSSSKRSEPAPHSAEASATNYYANERPAVPPYSAVHSSSSSYPHVSAAAATSRGPQAAAVDGQEGATVAGGQGSSVADPSFKLDCPPADPAPTFELKGLNFLSDSPLSSGSTSVADVYNSEKLNFL